MNSKNMQSSSRETIERNLMVFELLFAADFFGQIKQTHATVKKNINRLLTLMPFQLEYYLKQGWKTLTLKGFQGVKSVVGIPVTNMSPKKTRIRFHCMPAYLLTLQTILLIAVQHFSLEVVSQKLHHLRVEDETDTVVKKTV